MWPTPQAVPLLVVTHSLELPPSGEWARIIKGALWEIARAENWYESSGGLSLDDTLEVMEAVYSSLKRAFIMEPGDIFLSYRAISDDSALLCDGSRYFSDEYPLLAEALLGITWSDADEFEVPDFAGRMPIGEGAGGGLTARALNDGGGSETHTLITSEIPSHSHGIHSHLTSMAQLGVGEPVSIPGLGGDTDSTGGGDPHNNMPPFRACYVYIVTGL